MTQSKEQPNPIPKVYEPQKVEERLYKTWMEKGYFKPKIDRSKKPFTIIMPPPNCTGELHVGHALTASIEDALIRWHRMKGDPTLWLPGTDHAGIATQVVVDRQLAKDGLDRTKLGREKYLERVWEWVQTSKQRIGEQHQRLGASCDWSREQFTMDAAPSKAVRKTFVDLYNKGLIYQGERIINWDPVSKTALSDLEVEHKDVQGSLWHFKYPLADGSGHVVVATTRPETYLGDTAVAVHPEDPRYRKLIGKKVKLPIIGREIPIVGDDAVSREFGTGAVKVTPAHDPTDFDIGTRHKLPFINVMNADATINEHGGPFKGQDRFTARKNIVAEFEKLGLLEKIEKHSHAVGHSQRTGVPVEPIVSKQWFVKVGNHDEPDSIAGRAHQAVAGGEIKVVPERFTKVYLNWMENIRDWCISRQLWWGHRIPVWYCDTCKHKTVATEDPTACEECGSKKIHQDNDVLDTWFSSALWPHSTLGWPEQKDDLKYFYPTAVMETGYDILFFWVARMIMMGIQNTGEIPFRTVYLHGLIRDEHGEKMSKVKGNVVNPLEVIDQYGTDALRFALTTGTSPGNDARLTTTKLENSRNFANKLWNAARFVMSSIDQAGGKVGPVGTDLPLEDRWILSRLNRTTAKVNQLMEEFQLGEAQREIYDFLWSEYADWFIELSKTRLKGPKAQSPLPVLAHALEVTLRLLHPFMPFVTEEIWQSLVTRLPPDRSRTESIVIAPYPVANAFLIDDDAEQDVRILMDVITAIRNARAEMKLDPMKQVEAIVDAASHRSVVEAHKEAVATLARANPVRIYGNGQPAPTPDGARVAVLGAVRVIIPTAGLVDPGAEKQKLEKEMAGLADATEKLAVRLDSEAFTSKAPAAVVEKEKARLAEYQEKLGKMRERMRELG